MKEIKNTRSREAQGTRAGFVSQALALVLDAAWILLVYILILLAFGIVRGLFTSHSFAMPKPPTWVSLIALFLIAMTTLEAPGMMTSWPAVPQTSCCPASSSPRVQ